MASKTISCVFWVGAAFVNFEMSTLLLVGAYPVGLTVNSKGFSPNLLGFQGLNPAFVVSTNSINFPIFCG